MNLLKFKVIVKNYLRNIKSQEIIIVIVSQEDKKLLEKDTKE